MGEMDLKVKYESFVSALARLNEAYEKALNASEDDYTFFRDSTIQRFEFTVEAFWKLLKEFLKDKEGKICNSPKSCIREMFATNYFEEEVTDTFLSMVDDRNMTSHTYHEEIAEMIFKRMKNYIELMSEAKQKILEHIR